MNYLLFLDDERTIDMIDITNWPEPFRNGNGVIVVRSSEAAIEAIKSYGGDIIFLSLDHDLGLDLNGKEDTSMIFLKRWMMEIWDGKTPPPDFYIHSANPIGVKNLSSYLTTWKKICE